MQALRRLTSLWRQSAPPPGPVPVIMAAAGVDAKEVCETSYPHKVDVRVPRAGLGRKVDDMVLWCDEHSSGAWDSYDHRNGGRSYLRFYFMEGALASAFAAAWSGLRRT